MSKIAFIYPGQGAQTVGMGKDFYDNSEVVKEIYHMASEVTGLDMVALCFEESDKLNNTEYTQAALVTTCLAMTKIYMDNSEVKPDITAGLSLGEYCAISVSGGLDMRDAISLVRERGKLMENALPKGYGGMTAVLGLKKEQIEQIVDPIEHVSIANYNCPGQIVITGEAAALLRAEECLKEAGAKRVLPLKVSGPFHSPLLYEAGQKLGEKMKSISFHPLKRPYVTNVTAQAVTNSEETKKLLTCQVSAPVKWEQSMKYMLDNGVDTFVEIGPGKTLNGFLRKINKEVKVINVSKWEDVTRG
jgi:malonyl CoA-acyl carrier protein transacylase